MSGERTICQWIGHRREYREGPAYFRRGRWRTPSYARCTRCGTSDGDEVYRPGYLEGLSWWNLRWSWWHLCTAIRQWWRYDCEDCKRPCVRFGRAVGEHERCDVIPF